LYVTKKPCAHAGVEVAPEDGDARLADFAGGDVVIRVASAECHTAV
jgi:hypothetical protein